MELQNRFGRYITNLRKEKEISLEQLSDGLCAISMLSRFERGEREPDKLLQNRFLTRLGVVPENYENFLDYDDYCRWERRQGILHYILEENMTEAKRLLQDYHEEYKMNEALEQQFYLAMLAQIRRYEGAKPEELAEIFGKALELTVPEIDTRSFRNRILSLEELNLLLEYRYCTGKGISLKFYENLLEYTDRMGLTVLAKAKIYPKVVYYYYMVWKASPVAMVSAERLLVLCDNAIEILRDANRMFYLWELFCMRENLLKRLPDDIRQEANARQRSEECCCWRKTLEGLFEEYKITLPMYEYCYIYVESENYCIGDVIRIRRKMLGLTQEELSGGICDSRTISRLERHLRKPQKEIVQKLFERLNLSAELCRTEVVTEHPETIEKYRELKKTIDNYETEKAEKMIADLSLELDSNNPTNKQALARAELLNLENSGAIVPGNYMAKIKEVLQYTIPYGAAIREGNKYLTNEELACLENIIINSKWESNEVRECIISLYGICNKAKYLINYIRLYEFIMTAISNQLGNAGMHDVSTDIEKSIIKLALQNRRIRSIHYALYEVFWNNEHLMNDRDKLKLIEKRKRELNNCIQISRLCKENYRSTKYFEKYDEL